MPFNPKQHLMKVRGGAEYLEVKWRLVWFREDHPDWGIETKPVEVDIEKEYAAFHATIYNAEGRLIASGTKMETKRDFADYVEKAETGAIGRALAVCGYGTQFAPELEEGERIVDSPVQRPQRPTPPPVSKPAPQGPPPDAAPDVCSVEGCGTMLTEEQAAYAKRKWGKLFCKEHKPPKEG